MNKFRPYWNFTAFYYFSFAVLLLFAMRLLPADLLRSLRPNLTVWAFIQRYGLSNKNGFLPPLFSFIWLVGLPFFFLIRAALLDFFRQPKGKGRYLALFAAVSVFIADFSVRPKIAHTIAALIMAVILRAAHINRDSLPRKKKKLNPEQQKRAGILSFVRSILGFTTVYGAGYAAMSAFYLAPNGALPTGILKTASLWAGVFLIFALFLDCFRTPKGRGGYLAAFALASWQAYQWLDSPKDWHLFAAGGLILVFLAVHAAYSTLYGDSLPRRQKPKSQQ